MVRNEAGDDVWEFGGKVIANMGLNAVVGRPKDEYGIDPTSWDEMRPGCFDVHERVKDMNAAGVLGSMNFPSFPGFCGRLFADEPDKKLARAVTEAYNDFVIDEWCAAYPDRFIPMALPMMWDVDSLRGGGEAGRGQGLPLPHLLREPPRSGLPELPRRVLGSAVEGGLRRRHGGVASTWAPRASSSSRRRTRPST